MIIVPAFRLHRPQELDEALGLLAGLGPDAQVYMGGTELVLLMKLGFASPDHLVDGKRISSLHILEAGGGVVRIGAAVTYRRLERSSELAAVLPALRRMASMIGNVRVRSAGTMVGNVCFGEPHSDPGTLLSALGATIELRSAGTQRTVSVADFIAGPLDTDLREGEMATQVTIPVPRGRVAFQRLALRERPTVNAAVVYGPGAARVVVGALGPRPVRVPAAEALLTDLEPDTVRRAAGEVRAAVAPVEDHDGSADYKAHLAGVLFTRACGELRAGAGPQPGIRGA